MLWLAAGLVSLLAVSTVAWAVLVVAGLGRILRGPRQPPTEPTPLRGPDADTERRWRHGERE